MTIATKEVNPLSKAQALEKEANQFLAEKKVDEAFRAFDEAARIYRDAKQHMNAAICYSLAATCWNIHTGWQPLKNAASRNYLAAKEAQKAQNHSYARDLYREAALLYEREGDFEKYSECFIESQNSNVCHLRDLVWGANKEEESRGRIKSFFKYCLGQASRYVWGYGEKPLQMFVSVLVVILSSAIIYEFSALIEDHGRIRGVNFFESLYFSFVTFATVGYGDFLPTGWVRWVAVLEALSGIFLMPLFLVALTRRYLRLVR